MDPSGPARPGATVCGRRSGSAHPQRRFRKNLAGPDGSWSPRLASVGDPPLRARAIICGSRQRLFRESRWRRHMAVLREAVTAEIPLEYRNRFGGCGIRSSFRPPPPRGTLTPSRRNHICTGARRVLRGSNSAMACPSWPDGAPPFWPAIRGSRECSSRLGNATCIFQSTAERTGTVCMCLGRRIVALTKYVRSQSANTNEHQRMCSISLIPWIIESFDLCIYRPEILPAYVQHDFNTATHPKGRLSHT